MTRLTSKPAFYPILGLVFLPFYVWLTTSNLFFICGVLISLLFWLYSRTVLKKIAEPKDEWMFDTIGASHYCEKVRWCMDYINFKYTETVNAGIFGVVFEGRMVPRLTNERIRTVIGNSPDILSYIRGKVSNNPLYNKKCTKFLESTEFSNKLEQKLDAFGKSVQVGLYYYILQDKEIALKLWLGDNDSRIPRFQCLVVRYLFPIFKNTTKKGLNINVEASKAAHENIVDTLLYVSKLLNDGRKYLLGDYFSYIDVVFCSLAYPFMFEPQLFGNGLFKGFILGREILDKYDKFMETYVKIKDTKAMEYMVEVYKKHRKEVLKV